MVCVVVWCYQPAKWCGRRTGHLALEQLPTARRVVRCVYVGYADTTIAPAYGFYRSRFYNADEVAYPAESDAEFAGEAADSDLLFGRIPALLIRTDIVDDETALEFAKWFFLRRAVRARTLRVSWGTSG